MLREIIYKLGLGWHPADSVSARKRRRQRRERAILIIVENLPVPFDARVWQEANALRDAGFGVAVICPKGKGHTAAYERIRDIHIYRHPLPVEASGPLGFLNEYASALFWEFLLSVRVWRRHGFFAIHACNPPDLIFLIGLFYKLALRKRFVFDHHDICPELYEAKFGRRGPLHRLLGWLERCTFRCADAVIATNGTFKHIAVQRGKVSPERIWVVKSYPDVSRLYRVPTSTELRAGHKYLIGYIGIMGTQDGVDGLLGAIAHIAHARGRTEIGCIVIGDGPELANLKALAKALQIEPYVTFSGYLTGDRLLEALSSIDLGVIPDPPNVYNDKISMNKVFEYMSLGIPFVQFDLAESVNTAGNAAVTVAEASSAGLGDAIVELLEDPEKRRSMSACARERAEREFQWQKEKTKLIEAYHSLLQQTAPAGQQEAPGGLSAGRM